MQNASRRAMEAIARYYKDPAAEPSANTIAEDYAAVMAAIARACATLNAQGPSERNCAHARATLDAARAALRAIPC